MFSVADHRVDWTGRSTLKLLRIDNERRTQNRQTNPHLTKPNSRSTQDAHYPTRTSGIVSLRMILKATPTKMSQIVSTTSGNEPQGR